MEPLSDQQVEARCASVVQSGTVFFSEHAEEEMDDDDISKSDVRNVLRAGWCEMPDGEPGSWRYRMCSNKFTVVIAFTGDDELCVVTAWRNA